MYALLFRLCPQNSDKLDKLKRAQAQLQQVRHELSASRLECEQLQQQVRARGKAGRVVMGQRREVMAFCQAYKQLQQQVRARGRK